jgi:hypothetical protein
MTRQLFVLSICLLLYGIISGQKEAPKDSSPYIQNLPDCSQPYQQISKKTNAKAILCPMIRYSV